MVLAHLRREETKTSLHSSPSNTDITGLIEEGLLPEFFETLGPVSMDELADLKRRYAAFILQIDRLRPALRGVDTEMAPEDEAWSIREILGHLVDTDRNIWWPRIEAARTADHPHFENIDPNELIQEHNWRTQPIEDILSRLVRSRWHYGMKLNSLVPEEFERSGNHPALGELSILRMLQIMVAHDEHYLGKIRARIAASVLEQ